MKYKQIVFYYLIFITGSAVSFGSGYLIRALQDLNKPPTFPVLEQAYDILESHAYHELPGPPALEYGMVRGMVAAFDDPYTRFEEPVQHELNSDQLEGKYGGIGASLEHDSEGFVLLHPFPEGPASAAGILDGDRLIRVDGWEIAPGTPLDEVVAAIRGPEGDQVMIEIIRHPSLEILSFTITRKDIPLPSVTWYLESSEPWLGIIRVNIIAASTVDEIQTAIKDLSSRGATHFALDLRENRGGLLDAGIDIARLLLENGTIIQEHYRDQEIKSYDVKKPGLYAEIPLVVLVNINTASAAEIIAGSLKAHNRAQIIGTNTFGKDSIQLVFDLKDNSSLHVTTAKWWVPDLDPPIGEGGLAPDFPVSDEDVEGDPYLQAAIQIFQENQ